MKTLTILAGLMAAATVSVPAFAQSAAPAQAGHWEWRAQPSYGPRSPLRPPARVWVADVNGASKATKAADCDCAVMHAMATKSADCMEMDKAGS